MVNDLGRLFATQALAELQQVARPQVVCGARVARVGGRIGRVQIVLDVRARLRAARARLRLGPEHDAAALVRVVAARVRVDIRERARIDDRVGRPYRRRRGAHVVAPGTNGGAGGVGSDFTGFADAAIGASK